MDKKQIDIEDLLVWTYQVEYADKATTDGPRLGRGYDSVVRVCSAKKTGGYHCHPDADAVHFHVLQMPVHQQMLLLRAAKSGIRPGEGATGRFVMVAVLNSRGNPKAIQSETSNMTVGHVVAPAIEMPDGEIIFAPEDRSEDGIQWFGDVVGAERSEYVEWYETLSFLALQLNGGAWLSAHFATGPKAPARPWEAC